MNFRCRHIIFPAHKSCTVTLEPIFPVTINPSIEYSAKIIPFSGLRRYGLRNSAIPISDKDEAFFAETHPLRTENDVLSLDISFPQEDRYLIKFFIGETLLETYEIYALEPDLFSLTPFKGDNHLHTYMSDGRESPMYMAAMCCLRGYDYCAITDHREYDPSLIARDYYKDTNVDFLIVPGEEVHSPDNIVHLINFGGTESVNDWWRDHEDEYRAAVAKEMESMTEPMTVKDRYCAAASNVMFDRIRMVDGVSILCHPNYIIERGFNESEDITDYLMDHRRFDALELIAGGAYEVGTQMQLSYYLNRENMPIVGSSDAHGCFGTKLEPGNFTIVFAEDLSVDSLKKSIRAAKTVAGNANKLYGDYRLVKYAYFLIENYYPAHDAQRSKLSNDMLRFASSGKDSEFGTRLAAIRPSEMFAPLRWNS